MCAYAVSLEAWLVEMDGGPLVQMMAFGLSFSFTETHLQDVSSNQ